MSTSAGELSLPESSPALFLRGQDGGVLPLHKSSTKPSRGENIHKFKPFLADIWPLFRPQKQHCDSAQPLGTSLKDGLKLLKPSERKRLLWSDHKKPRPGKPTPRRFV